jgi:hypothetical protein
VIPDQKTLPLSWDAFPNWNLVELTQTPSPRRAHNAGTRINAVVSAFSKKVMPARSAAQMKTGSFYDAPKIPAKNLLQPEQSPAKVRARQRRQMAIRMRLSALPEDFRKAQIQAGNAIVPGGEQGTREQGTREEGAREQVLNSPAPVFPARNG